VAAAAILCCLVGVPCSLSGSAFLAVALTSEPATVGAVVTVGAEGAATPLEYLGISLASWALCDLLEDDATNGAAYEQLYRNLGPGVLHVGGFSSDTAEWEPTGTASCGNPTVVTESEVDAFFQFVQRIGWKVLWGLPLELPDPPVPATDAAQAAYVASVAGGSLVGFSIGNEPNLYVANGDRPPGWGPTNYYQEWAGVREAVLQAVPGAGIVAPEVCCADAVFTQAFDEDAAAAGDQLSGLSFHYYAPFGRSDQTAANLLAASTMETLVAGATGMWDDDVEVGSPPLDLTEANTFSGGGMAGVSDTFASSLWMSDVLFEAAGLHVAEVDVAESGGAEPYNPIGPGGVAEPVYYGMLLYRSVVEDGGHLLSTDVDTSLNVTAHAVEGSDGSTRVVLVNKTASPATVQVDTGTSYRSAFYYQLLAPSLSSTTGVTLGGSSVSSQGTWTPVGTTALPLDGNQASLTLPAYSVTCIVETSTAPVEPPAAVTASSTAAGEATLSWSPALDALSEDVVGYEVTTYDDQGEPVGRPQAVTGTSTSITGLTDGTPWYWSVAAVNPIGTGTAAESNSVTPLSGSTPAAAMTALSQSQYLLPNSDGSTWQVMDEDNLAFTITPSSSEDVLLSANADLWTFSAGYNQDIGIQVTAGSGTPVLAAWKESGGFAGTFSPNAAFVETVYPMSAGTTYTVQIVWKTNRAAIPSTIAAGAGSSPTFSPTRLTADVLPSGYQSVVSTQQYSSVNSNGSTWAEIDPTNLVTGTFAPTVDQDLVVSGNADLWTANAGYNQDLGIFVSVNGRTPILVAWKESGGFAGTFSPNAAYVQAVYPMTAGNTYVFSLWWKTNIPANGTIYVGAGPIGSAYSPTRLTAYPLPADSAPEQWGSVDSTEQYSLSDSDGSTWTEMDPTKLATSISVPGGDAAETVLVSGNADLWTADGGYNQDLGIFVSEDGGTPTLVAWKESGGFAGTDSPNAAFVQAVYTLEPGHSYAFSLWWKTNIPAPGATIYAAAGPIGSAYSPTRLTLDAQQ
jgi:hypothetical protein